MSKRATDEEIALAVCLWGSEVHGARKGFFELVHLWEKLAPPDKGNWLKTAKRVIKLLTEASSKVGQA